MFSIEDAFNKYNKHKETISKITDLTCGCDQYVYLITTNTNNKYILKKPKTEPIKISNEVFALTIIKDKGKDIPIPQLLYYDDTILIESYLEGIHLKPNEEQLDLYEELGKYIKAMHSILIKGFGPINSKGEGSLETEKNYLPFCLNPTDPSFATNKYMKDLDIPGIISNTSDLFNNDSSAVLVHGDLHCPNILTHKGRISGIIDFADIIANVAEYDLAYYYIHLLNMNAWDNFIKGYGTNFNMKKVYFYVFILGTWLLSSDNITNEEAKTTHFNTSLKHLI